VAQLFSLGGLKRMKIHSHFLSVVALACLAFLFAGCETQDSFPRHHHVGDIYEVVGNLCIIGDSLKDEEMTDLAGWQTWGDKFHHTFEKLPIGTQIKIVDIEKETRSSWNTGRYSYYLVFVNVLTNGHEGVRYDASHLMYGGEKFGDNGSNLVTLKIVYDASKK
jgi:hypothetical protein